MAADLKYDTDIFAAAVAKIEGLITQLETDRDAMKKGLEQIRSDWVSEGADAFFDSIDKDWENSVQTCIDTLTELKDEVSYAQSAYAQIEEDAGSYLTF